ncbi:hypothetical protein Q3G72_017669 [Acer saccharum]|nr:hypothetical protein Q3G72_017669 [Acer saccharum]
MIFQANGEWNARLDIQLWGLVSLFVFATNWDFNDNAIIFNRIKKLKEQFAHLYVVVTLPTRELNESFVRSYFEYGMQLGRPTFLPAHCRGVCKRHDAISKMKAEFG